MLKGSAAVGGVHIRHATSYKRCLCRCPLMREVRWMDAFILDLWVMSFATPPFHREHLKGCLIAVWEGIIYVPTVTADPFSYKNIGNWVQDCFPCACIPMSPLHDARTLDAICARFANSNRQNHNALPVMWNKQRCPSPVWW